MHEEPMVNPQPMLLLELTTEALRLRPLRADERAFDNDAFKASVRKRWPKMALVNISKKLGVSEAGLRQVISGTREPSLDFYHKLCVGMRAPIGSWWRGVQLHAGQS